MGGDRRPRDAPARHHLHADPPARPRQRTGGSPRERRVRAGRATRPALAAGAAALAWRSALAGLRRRRGDVGDDGRPSRPRRSTTDDVRGRRRVTASDGGFDAGGIYDDAAPSVVTILSVFGDPESAIAHAQAGQGSGFVIDDDGEIVTNAHVVTDAGETGAPTAARSTRRDEVYVEFGDRNQVPAEIIGFDPNADIALIKVDPDGLDLEPIEFGDSDERRGRLAGRRDRQPVRPGAVALDRRSSRRPTARSSRSPSSRSTARSRPTPRSTPATPAAR